MSATSIASTRAELRGTEPAQRSGVAKFASDTWAVMIRELMLVLRDPFSLVFSLVQPLVFLALFAPLLGGLVGEQGIDGVSPLQWFLPGVVVMICVFGTGMTGSNLLFEMQLGSYERILATPLSRASIIVGRSLKEFVPLVVQALVITLAATPFGFTLYLGHVLVGLLILGVFGIGAGALSYALAIVSRKTEWMFWAVQQSVTFPLLLLSGMMLPLETGPGWMQTVSRANPLTYIVDAERALFAGTFSDPVILWGALAAIATCAVGLAVGIGAIRRAAR
ncbi:ABC-2 type transporter [Beutenbergia cavernae DSM 12333]|uniref:Transport permease protein n=1 Tax=Beutenbergia cavernae (strain ATCC BAA-8 / DSM 12333 / CCUG 43141 / JCM 11478 / NBRC 16432 / NCIMB 13614 / HKI 0122) TaxID=471853 RepID=C5C4K0_BEUC1|nr:ABC transporter permease [Beutenbergia cavernae]ACQ82124.1 ABC-2 type transporter [Beutenbergia cavernae DSM 12333]